MVAHQVENPDGGPPLLIDADIPGQIGMEALVAMARLARNVPPGGIVVETGSLYGRSAFVWAKNVDPSVTVYCIDPWVRERWIVEVVEQPQKVERPFSLEAFLHYTRDCPNIVTIQGTSPKVVKRKWKQPIDLFFDDADHDDPGLSRNRNFWIPWIKPGGYFCADEYDAQFPACLRRTHELAIRWKVPVDRVGLFCWMRRP